MFEFSERERKNISLLDWISTSRLSLNFKIWFLKLRPHYIVKYTKYKIPTKTNAVFMHSGWLNKSKKVINFDQTDKVDSIYLKLESIWIMKNDAQTYLLSQSKCCIFINPSILQEKKIWSVTGNRRHSVPSILWATFWKHHKEGAHKAVQVWMFYALLEARYWILCYLQAAFVAHTSNNNCIWDHMFLSCICIYLYLNSMHVYKFVI